MEENNDRLVITTCAAGLICGFIDALFTIYYRKIIPASQWALTEGNTTKIKALFHKYNLLWSEQAREVAIWLLLLLITVIIAKQSKRRWAAFLTSVSLWKAGRLLSLYFLIDWPRNFTSYDILSLWPYASVVPIWTIIAFCLFFSAAAYLILKRSNTPVVKNQFAGETRSKSKKKRKQNI